MGIHSASHRYSSTTYPQINAISVRTSTSSLKHRKISQETISTASSMSILNMYELLANVPECDNESDTSGPTDPPSSDVLKQSLEEDNKKDSKGSKVDDDDPMDEEDIATHTTFDLITLEEAQNHKPIFTKALLQRIASEASAITAQQSQLVLQRTQTSLHFDPPTGPPIKIWQAINTADSVAVHYATRVEMCPSFQTRFNTVWKNSKELRSLNKDMSEADFCQNTAPYFFTSWLRAPSDRHEDKSIMKNWRARLSRTQSLWRASQSCAQIRRIVRDGASRLKRPITKIVCVGLGALNSQAAWYQAALQHMTVFSLAAELDSLNRGKFPGSAAVKVIASDPCYEELDRICLQELTSSRITFGLSDPETLLAIDGNTLVVTAFLPLGVPLMQIVADLWAESPKDGPGMMICDQMPELSLGRREYCLRNRGSPGVARMLANGYWGSKEKIVDMEEELRADVMGQQKDLSYWLQKMGIYLKKE